jgi:formamidopyrimidine-DNA glycosylase
MPELPEVETTRRGILPFITGKTLTGVSVSQPKLRYPVPEAALTALIGQTVIAVNRRAKYLLIHFAHTSIIIHLGMSGSLRLITPNSDWRLHDHWQLCFGDQTLRYHDPRRFGFILVSDTPKQHPLLSKLAPEPLGDDFTPDYLYQLCQRRRSPIKSLIMNNHNVVGVGNIYACESLFLARLHPLRIANTLSLAECQNLHRAIVDVLTRAIKEGGSTLRDFINPNGQPGYFAQTLHVYGREGKACPRCQTAIANLKQAGRSSFYCPSCQPIKRTRKKPSRR